MTSDMTIRPATADDGAGIFEMRRSAIQHVPATYYDQVTLDEWSGSGEGSIQTLLSNAADIRIVAIISGKIAGYGELVTKENI